MHEQGSRFQLQVLIEVARSPRVCLYQSSREEGIGQRESCILMREDRAGSASLEPELEASIPAAFSPQAAVNRAGIYDKCPDSCAPIAARCKGRNSDCHPVESPCWEAKAGASPRRGDGGGGTCGRPSSAGSPQRLATLAGILTATLIW